MNPFQRWVFNTIANLGGNPIAYLIECNQADFEGLEPSLLPIAEAMLSVNDFCECNVAKSAGHSIQKVCQSFFVEASQHIH